MSEEKFSKCGKGGNVSVTFRVFGKKMEIERKVAEKKNQSVFLDESLKERILLSSYSLVGLYVNLQVKVTEKNGDRIFKVFFGSVFEVTVAIAKKILKFRRNVRVVSVPLVGRHVD